MTKSIDLIPTWFWPEGIPRYISLPRATAFANTVERWARRTPEAPAIGEPMGVTYAQLGTMATTAAANMRRLLGEADNRRVAITTGRGAESVAVLLGAMQAGLDILPIDEGRSLERQIESVRSFRAGLHVTAVPNLVSGIGTATFDECLERGASTDLAGGPDARVAFEWGESIVFHPTATLLGWALAFRAFSNLQPGDRFLTSHRLASWEGLTSLLAPLAVGAPYRSPIDLLHSPPPHTGPRAESGAWISIAELQTVTDHPQASRWLEGLDWVYVSVESSLAARTRRRIARQLRAPILTIMGTPATGPVVASPREWSIDQAVGIPFTCVDLVPLDDNRQPVIPPWHLISPARVGVRSSLLAEGLEVEGGGTESVLPGPLVDTGFEGLMDANGFLYLG